MMVHGIVLAAGQSSRMGQPKGRPAPRPRRTDLRRRRCHGAAGWRHRPSGGRRRRPSRRPCGTRSTGWPASRWSTIPTGRPVNCRRCWPDSTPSTIRRSRPIAVTLVDVPLVRASTVAALLAAWRRSRRADRPSGDRRAPWPSGDLRPGHVRRAARGAARGRRQGGDRRLSAAGARPRRSTTRARCATSTRPRTTRRWIAPPGGGGAPRQRTGGWPPRPAGQRPCSTCTSQPRNGPGRGVAPPRRRSRAPRPARIHRVVRRRLTGPSWPPSRAILGTVIVNRR